LPVCKLVSPGWYTAAGRIDSKQRQPDISLARQKLGWEPKVDLHDGLRRTIDYFKSIA